MALETEDRPSDSPYVARVWRSRTSGVERMTSVATSHWELVVWGHRGRVHAAVRGPETVATTVDVPDESESFGITFTHGTSLVHLPPGRLVDSALESPHATARAFVLGGDEWAMPGFESAEQFADRLVRAGLLVRDPLVHSVVEGDEAPTARRTHGAASRRRRDRPDPGRDPPDRAGAAGGDPAR